MYIFILLCTVSISIIFSVFATQNTGLVSLYFSGYQIKNIPVYLVVLVPVLFSLIFCTVIQSIRNLSLNYTINHQKKLVRGLKRDLGEVTKDLHKLELENAKFKNELGEPQDEDSL